MGSDVRICVTSTLRSLQRRVRQSQRSLAGVRSPLKSEWQVEYFFQISA